MTVNTLELPKSHARTEGPCHATAARWFMVSALVLTVAIISRVGMIAWPFLNDSGLYAYMGKTVANGGVLYRDFYETKLPGVGLITSAFWRAFGPWWPGYVLCQLVLAILGAAMLARMARRHSQAHSALPTFLYAAVFLNFCWLVFTGFQLEPIQAFFETLAAAAAMEAIAGDQLPDAFTAGLAAGVAAMLKPSGIAVGVAFLLVLIWQRRNESRNWLSRCGLHTMAFAMGASIPIGVTIIYTIRAGLVPYLPDVIRQISRYANATPINAFALMKLAIMGAVMGLPMLMRVVPIRRQTKQRNYSPNRLLLLFAIAWFLVDLLGVIIQRRMYLYHFLPLVCPAALLYGMMPRPARPMQVIAGLLPIALLSLRWQGTAPLHLERGFVHMPVSDYIIAHTSPGDCVYMDQIGRLLIETDRLPGSRYGTFFYFINYDQAPLDFCNGMIADFEDRKPKYVVDAVDASTNRQTVREPILDVCPVRRANFLLAGKMYDEYLEQHYIVETIIDGNKIYRRK